MPRLAGRDRHLPASALLSTWLDAVRLGDAGPDDLEAAVRGQDPRHLVIGVPGHDVLELHQVPAAAGRTGLAGAPRPWRRRSAWVARPALNLAAIEAGEAVVAGPVGLVPEVDARTVVWRAHPAERVPWTDERESASELRIALADVTRRLVDLDVASWQPEIPDLLMNLRHRPPLRLPPGLDPRRRRDDRASAAVPGDRRPGPSREGGAVSAYEMERRRDALTDLDRAARRALVGACSARAG